MKVMLISETTFGNLDLKRLKFMGPSRPSRLPLGPPRRSERGEEVDKGKEREKEVVDEDKEAVTTIVLEDEDVDTIYSEDVNEVGVIGDDDGGVASINGDELESTTTPSCLSTPR